jgi:hypothetical protein
MINEHSRWRVLSGERRFCLEALAEAAAVAGRTAAAAVCV